MGQYSNMSDDDLVAELTSYRAAKKSLALGGQLAVIAGEGRRKEVTRANPQTLYADLRELEAEFARRPSLNPGGSTGGSLEIVFGRGPFCG